MLIDTSYQISWNGTLIHFALIPIEQNNINSKGDREL